jgi:type II secretory pathway pseudopilin PulG
MDCFKTTTHTKGFTLLETLISIGIISTVGILIAQVFFATTRSNTKTEVLKDVKQNGEHAIEVISRMIRSSINVETTCLTTGSTLTSLDIRNQDGNITTIGCALDNSVTRVASTSATGVTPEFLTSSNVTLGGASCVDISQSLSFLCTSYPDQAPKIVVSFRLSQKGTPADQFEKASAVFQTTVSPRF